MMDDLMSLLKQAKAGKKYDGYKLRTPFYTHFGMELQHIIRITVYSFLPQIQSLEKAGTSHNIPFGKFAPALYTKRSRFRTHYTPIDTKLHYTINSRMDLADTAASNPNSMYDSRKFDVEGIRRKKKWFILTRSNSVILLCRYVHSIWHMLRK